MRIARAAVALCCLAAVPAAAEPVRLSLLELDHVTTAPSLGPGETAGYVVVPIDRRPLALQARDLDHAGSPGADAPPRPAPTVGAADPSPRPVAPAAPGGRVPVAAPNPPPVPAAGGGPVVAASPRPAAPAIRGATPTAPAATTVAAGGATVTSGVAIVVTTPAGVTGGRAGLGTPGLVGGTVRGSVLSGLRPGGAIGRGPVGGRPAFGSGFVGAIGSGAR